MEGKEQAPQELINSGSSHEGKNSAESLELDSKQKQQLVRKETHKNLTSLHEEKRVLAFKASKVEELPKDLKKLVRATKLNDEHFEKNFTILLNVLHFLTKKVYVSSDTLRKRENENPQHNEEVKDSQPSTLREKPRKLTSVVNEHVFDTTTRNPKDLFKGLKKHGKGGFGVVFVGKIVGDDNKKVAVKKTAHTSLQEKTDNFNEVRYLRMCNSPNIVKLLNAYEFKDECWMVFEYLEGGTLTESRRGHEFQENEIAYVARELLKGISHIHSLNLVHRDVKSENIMMSIMGDIKLIDFGLCTEASLIKKPSMLGSPYWMPPEMIQRQPHSFPADIWSFGVSLLELTNKNPPNAENKLKAMFNVGTIGIPHPFDEPQKWSDNYKDFISKCLEMDPTKRGTAPQLLKHPFLEQAAHTRRVMRKILSEIFLQRAIGLM